MRFVPDKTAVILDMVENYRRHGLPTTEHAWSLKYVSYNKLGEAAIKNGSSDEQQVRCFNFNTGVVNTTVACDKCFAVYDGATIYCEPCGGWDMRKMKCRECRKEQQYGFGECAFCGGGFSILIDDDGGGFSTGIGNNTCKTHEQIDADLQELKSFRFRESDNHKIIDELRHIQKANRLPLSWIYNTLKEMGM